MESLHKNHHRYYLIIVSLLLLVPFLSLITGRYQISLEKLLHPALLSSREKNVLWMIRLPRILGALFIGAALAGTGSIYQTIFRNPMVSPSVVGASSGAAFGAAVSLLFQLPGWMVQLISFLSGTVSVGAAVIISYLAGRRNQTLLLVLAGMLVSTFFTALISLVKFAADPQNTLPAITYWLMGSLADISLNEALLTGGIVVICSSILFGLRWKINLLALDDDEARSLGVNPLVFRVLVIILSTLMTSAAVSVSGIIGWIGLVIPHLVRLLFPVRFDSLFLVSLASGGLYLLLIDTFSRIAAPVEFPLGILTALIGAPFFAFFLLRKNKCGGPS